MRLPILSYGHGVLEEPCTELSQRDEDLPRKIEDMWDTLYGAKGWGLAAPQVGFPHRLFLVDSLQAFQRMDLDQQRKFFLGDEGIQEVFINPVLIWKSEERWSGTEGCLSIPNVSQPIERALTIELEYCNLKWEKLRRRFSGITARIIQHEYDHIEGKLILDHLNPITRLCLKGQLHDISTGKLGASYPMAHEEKV